MCIRDSLKNGIIASGAILQYLIMTQHTQIGQVTSLSRIEEDKYVRLDKFTVRSLELMGSMNDGGSSLLNLSLIHIFWIWRTSTSANTLATTSCTP